MGKYSMILILILTYFYRILKILEFEFDYSGKIQDEYTHVLLLLNSFEKEFIFVGTVHLYSSK